MNKNLFVHKIIDEAIAKKDRWVYIHITEEGEIGVHVNPIKDEEHVWKEVERPDGPEGKYISLLYECSACGERSRYRTPYCPCCGEKLKVTHR